MKPAYRYPWPASTLSKADLKPLHAVRESSQPRVSITDLVAHAVRTTYGNQAAPNLRALPHTEPAALNRAA